jgi:hypothetical protein
LIECAPAEPAHGPLRPLAPGRGVRLLAVVMLPSLDDPDSLSEPALDLLVRPYGVRRLP